MRFLLTITFFCSLMIYACMAASNTSPQRSSDGKCRYGGLVIPTGETQALKGCMSVSCYPGRDEYQVQVQVTGCPPYPPTDPNCRKVFNTEASYPGCCHPTEICDE